ncbi:MAG TPA: FCD domain-containing protein [Candidatus Limnocylindria bacterium]|nr:FCD domain-containing protein [Candidatus Limnocylindria bacterium]
MSKVDADLELHAALMRASRMSLGVAATGLASRLLRAELRARAAEHAGDARLHRLHRELVDAIDRRMEHRAARAARAIAWTETRPP